MKINQIKCNLNSTKLIVVFSLFSLFTSAQDSIYIRGQLLNNAKFAKVVVQKFGVGVIDIAAIEVDKETGNFSITAPSNVEPGIYRFRYSQTGYNEFIDVIINGKEKKISFNVDVSKDLEKRFPFFIDSEENKTWVTYLQKCNSLFNLIKLKQDFLIGYPNKKDKIFKKMIKELVKSRQTFLNEKKKLLNSTNFYWIPYMTRYCNFFFLNINEHEHIRLQQFQAYDNFWSEKPTNNSLLINTPLYTDAILTYLKYYMNPEMGFTEDEQTQGFLKSVDTIMSRFSGNVKTKEFALKYLQMGFKEIGNEKVLQYIDEKFAIKEQCTDGDEELINRLKGYDALKIGSKAPFFEFQNESGITKSLKDFNDEELVLVFWASWCPHCLQEMPKLQEFASSNKKLKIIAVSLDDDKLHYEDAKEILPDLLHFCDFQKWNGNIVKSYFVTATPTIIFIDAKGNIKNKYDSINSFLEKVKN